MYEYLDFRFGLKTKLLLSGFFLLSRTASTAVLIFGVASVIQLITGLNFFWAVMLFGLVTVIYDLLGGIKARSKPFAPRLISSMATSSAFPGLTNTMLWGMESGFEKISFIFFPALTVRLGVSYFIASTTVAIRIVVRS